MRGRKPQYIATPEERKIMKCKRTSKQIKDIRDLMNSILSNGCYSEKEELCQMIKITRNGSLTEKESKVLKKAWKFRRNKTKELIKELSDLLEVLDGNKKTKDTIKK